MYLDKNAPILRVKNISKDEFDKDYLNKGKYHTVSCYYMNFISLTHPMLGDNRCLHNGRILVTFQSLEVVSLGPTNVAP